MVNIFEYQNYRCYLKAYYEEQKATKRSFSYRKFSEKAGINTSSFLFYVIEGKRNLTKNSIIKISQAIGHNRKDADYFEYLVFFNQSKTIQDKTHYYSRLVEIREPLDIQTVANDRYEFYCKWYHSVIREVVTLFDFKDDFRKLAAFLQPSIRPQEAKASVILLERLGFIERDEEGLYHQTENLISVKSGLESRFVIEKFQTEMLEMAKKSYDIQPVKNRMSLSTTFSISEKSFELLKMRAREFQREIMEIARIDNEQNRSYQMTLNLFAVSRSADDV